MESKWQKKHNRETKWKTTLRRVRIPLLTVAGTFLVALVGLPLLLNGMESAALSADLPASAPWATPLPLPTEAQPLAAGQVVPEDTPGPNAGGLCTSRFGAARSNVGSFRLYGTAIRG